jgi:hypothetical protein
MLGGQTIHFLVVVRTSDSGTLPALSTSFVAMTTTATAIQLPPPIVN